MLMPHSHMDFKRVGSAFWHCFSFTSCLKVRMLLGGRRCRSSPLITSHVVSSPGCNHASIVRRSSRAFIPGILSLTLSGSLDVKTSSRLHWAEKQQGVGGNRLVSRLGLIHACVFVRSIYFLGGSKA